MILLVFLYTLSLADTARGQSGTDLKRLKTKLFTTDSYNNKVRPVADQSTTVQVTVDFALVGINSFVDSDQKLTTTGYLTVQWTDELLVWTPATYNGITSILVPQNDIWRPDITLDNGMASKTGLGKKFIQATVANDGKVTWSPYEVFQTSCSIDISHFPFDTQRCEIRFITWMNDDTKVKLNIGSGGFYTSNFEENGKWKVDSMSSSSETVDGKTTLLFTLNLRRKSSFYVLFLLLPAVLLSVLNVFVFVLPAGSGEKTGYTIAVFLSYALFYTILSESLPTNSDTVSTVASYLFLMMFLATLSVVLTIIELRIYKKQTLNPLPRWLVRFVKCILHQRCLPGCCCCYVTDDIDDDDVDGEWTKVIGPWLDCDWQDVVDALDFVLFWIFLILTVTSTTVAFSFSVSHIQIFS